MININEKIVQDFMLEYKSGNIDTELMRTEVNTKLPNIAWLINMLTLRYKNVKRVSKQKAKLLGTSGNDLSDIISFDMMVITYLLLKSSEYEKSVLEVLREKMPESKLKHDMIKTMEAMYES